MSHEGITNVDLVREQILNGTPRSQIPETINRSRRAVSSSVSYLRRLGELPRPTPEESRRVRQEAISKAQNGLFLTIEQHVRDGMSPEKIQELFREQGMELELNRIRISAKHIRRSMQVEAQGSLPDVYVRKPVEAIEAIKAQHKEKRMYQQAMKLSVPLAYRGLQKEEIEDFLTPKYEDSNSRKYARSLFEHSYITENLKYRDITHEIDQSSNRTWMNEIDSAVIMESYVMARIKEIKGDPEYMNTYIELGNSIDPLWFNDASNNTDRLIARKSIVLLGKLLSSSFN